MSKKPIVIFVFAQIISAIGFVFMMTKEAEWIGIIILIFVAGPALLLFVIVGCLYNWQQLKKQSSEKESEIVERQKMLERLRTC